MLEWGAARSCRGTNSVCSCCVFFVRLGVFRGMPRWKKMYVLSEVRNFLKGRINDARKVASFSTARG